jgi:hypothetical protein
MIVYYDYYYHYDYWLTIIFYITTITKNFHKIIMFSFVSQTNQEQFLELH